MVLINCTLETFTLSPQRRKSGWTRSNVQNNSSCVESIGEGPFGSRTSGTRGSEVPVCTVRTKKQDYVEDTGDDVQSSSSRLLG